MSVRVRELPSIEQTIQANRYENVFHYQFTNFDSRWGAPEVAIIQTQPTPDFIRSITDEYFLVLPIQGVTQLEWRCEDRHEMVRSFPGCITLHKRNVPVDYSWDTPVKHLCVRIYPTMITDVAASLCRGDPAHIELASISIFTDTLLEELCQTLLREAQYPSYGGQVYVETIGLALVTHLVRLGLNVNQSMILPQKKHTLSKRQLEIVTHYIKTYCDTNITLQDLAQLLNLSPYYFARQFKATTGLSPHEYLIRERVERAKKLLLAGEMNVAEVAHLVGFVDQSKFSHTFKRITGVVPREILKESKKRKI